MLAFFGKNNGMVSEFLAHVCGRILFVKQLAMGTCAVYLSVYNLCHLTNECLLFFV